MRSTKDLKEIVTGSRAKSKLNGIQGTPGNFVNGNNDGDNTTAAEDSEAQDMKRKGNWEKKFNKKTLMRRDSSYENDGGDLKEQNRKLERELDDIK